MTRSGWRDGQLRIDFASGMHTFSEHLREMLAMDSCLCSDEAFLARVHPDDRGTCAQ